MAISANTSWYLFNFRKNTILSLLENGYKVIAVAPRDSYSEKLEELGCQHMHVSIDQGGTNPFKDLLTLASLYRIFRNHKPVCVLNFTPKNNIYGSISARMAGTHPINNISGLGVVFVEKKMSSKLVLVLYRISQKLASKIFFQNPEDRKVFEKARIASTKKIDHVPGSGVDLKRFVFTPKSTSNKRIRFLLIARMLKEKGIWQFAEAARLLKHRYGEKVEFIMAGPLAPNNATGISLDEIRKWEESKSLLYLGSLDNVEEEIAKADCMVLPTYYREGVPKSLLESAAMGKPIVATRNVGCVEVVEDGVNGFLCEPKSVQSLVVALEKIMNLDEGARLEMGRKGREKMEKEFDERLVIKKYLDAIQDLVK